VSGSFFFFFPSNTSTTDPIILYWLIVLTGDEGSVYQFVRSEVLLEDISTAARGGTDTERCQSIGGHVYSELCIVGRQMSSHWRKNGAPRPRLLGLLVSDTPTLDNTTNKWWHHTRNNDNQRPKFHWIYLNFLNLINQIQLGASRFAFTFGRLNYEWVKLSLRDPHWFTRR